MMQSDDPWAAFTPQAAPAQGQPQQQPAASSMAAQADPWGAFSPQAPPEQPRTPAPVFNSQTGGRYNAQQEATYAAMLKNGELDPNAAPGSAALPRGQTDPNDRPEPGSWYVDLQGHKLQAPGLAADVAQGSLSGVEKAATGVADMIAGASPLGQVQQMLSTAAQLADGKTPNTRPFGLYSQTIDPLQYRPVTTPGRYAETIGEMIPNAVMPEGMLSKVAAVALPGIASQFAGDAAEKAGASPGMVQVARFLGGSAGGLTAGISRPGGQSALTVDQLRDAKNAAYAKVDASGFKFPQPAVQGLADAIGSEVARKGGPQGALLYPASNAMVSRLSALAAQPDGVPLSHLDELRSDIYGALVQPGDREAPIGSMMREKIDSLVNNSEAPDIAEARAANSRYMKAKAVTDKIESADLRSGSTYSGGNYNNAVRQALRPLIDPTSSQQIRNLTTDEAAALRRAITGTPTQNVTRYAGKLLTNKFVQIPAGILTHGIGPAVMEGAGQALNKVGQAQTQSALDRVLATISNGGNFVKPPPIAFQPDPLAPVNLGTILSLGRGAPLPAQSPRQ